MQFSRQSYYKAILAHDRRFDGLFFTCVSSTGIYCRPICPAQVPKLENCTFVSSPAAAEKAGFRPCLRCRPEYAPRNAALSISVARQLAAHIDETLLLDETLEATAANYAISSRHLRRLFNKEIGVEPKHYLTTRRLLYAKQLLQDTSLPIAQVAYAAGFTAPERLTIQMKQSYGFTPQKFRKQANSSTVLRPLLLRADYRPPFNWEALLQFLGGRATPQEKIEAGTYARSVHGKRVVVRNISERNYLTIEIPPELSRQSFSILSKVRKLFDLDANPSVIEASLSTEPILKKMIQSYPGVRVPGCWDNFEMLMRVILGQQVSVAGATTLMRRLVEAVGTRPAQIASSSPNTIATIGLPLKRATTLWQVGVSVQAGALVLDERDPQKFFDQLVAIPGIGPWTAEYLQMRALHWPDALPAGDLGLQKAIQPGKRVTERQLREHATAWQPWRSYATMLLWKSLENQGG